MSTPLDVIALTPPAEAAPPQTPPVVSQASFARDASSLIGAQGLITIAAVGTSIVTARALGVEGRGHFSMAVLLASILVTFTDFGIGVAGQRFTAMRKWPARSILGSHAVAAAVRLFVTASVGLVVIATLRDTLFPGVPAEYLVLGLLQLVSSVIAGYLLPLLLGLGLPGAYSRLLVLSSMLGFIGLAGFWVLFGLDVRSALVIQAASGVVTATAIWVQVRRAAGGVGRPDIGYLGAAYRFGAGVFASGVSSFANTRFVVLLINFHVGIAAVGLFTLAQTATDRIYLLADATGTLLLPKIAEDPKANSARLTPIVFRAAIVLGGLAAITLAILAEWFIRFLYSSEFAGAVPILRLLLVSVVLSSGWRVLSQDLNGRGRSGLTAAVNWAAAIINLGLAGLLLPQIGLAGAGWSAIASAAWCFLAGLFLYGGVTGAGVLMSPGELERMLAARALRGLSYGISLGPRFAWALLRAYVLDGLLLRAAMLIAPFRRRIADVIDRLQVPYALAQARRLECVIRSRPLKRPLVTIDELGLGQSSRLTIADRVRRGEDVVLGEFDHYGWLVPAFEPIRCLRCRSRADARPRSRSRICLVATAKGVGVRKEYNDVGARRRFLAEFRALERLRNSDAAVPEIINIEPNVPAITQTFIPGVDLEGILEAMGARLTGESIRRRIGAGASADEISAEYIHEGTIALAGVDQFLLAAIHEQLRAVHRSGVQLSDIKYGNIIVHQDTGHPFLVDFDSARLHDSPAGLAFLVERDRDVDRLNSVLGTDFATYKRLRDRIRTKQFPAADKLYASSYIGHGLRLGSLWDVSTGFGRWNYLLKRCLHLPAGARVLSLGTNNASVELQMLREGVGEVVAYEANPDYVAQGQFLAQAYSWADNREYRLRYVNADMSEATVAEGHIDCAMALCSLYYLAENEMRHVVAELAPQVSQFVLQCNVRRDIGRDDPDQYRLASVEVAVDVLQRAGFQSITVNAPRGYSRPLVRATDHRSPVPGVSH